MKKTKEKFLAIQLRNQGFSLNEISVKLKISKSTASLWLRDIKLSDFASKRLATRTSVKSLAGLKKYSEVIQKEKLESIIKDAAAGSSKLGSLNDRDVYCLGLGLYWGEGYKSGSQEFGFTNSDPQMICFYIHWLTVVFNVKSSELILRVSINNLHKIREIEIQKFWSRKTKIPLTQFTKISYIKSVSKKVYPDSQKYMGTLRIKVRKGTRMRREVLGAIKSIIV